MRRNWVVMNFNSSAISAKVSTSVKAFTVRVDGGKFAPAFGSSAHVRSSSPQKSLSFRMPRLKKPLLPPSVVTLSMRPRMTKSISSTGSPSRTMYVFSVNKHGFSRSHMASSSLSSMFANRGTYKQWIGSEYVSRLNQEKAGKNVLSYEETYNHYLTLCCKCNWAQPRDQSVGKNMLGEDETYNHYSRLTYETLRSSGNTTLVTPHFSDRPNVISPSDPLITPSFIDIDDGLVGGIAEAIPSILKPQFAFPAISKCE
nr:hypothetical protein CR513_22217 [Ipomoea trifida]